MDASDKANFAQTIAGLAVAFDQKDMTSQKIEIYWEALRDLPMIAVSAACRDVLQSAIHFPRVAEIRNLITAKAEDDANEKWAQCCELLRNCRNAKHPDPMVEDVIRQMGGWVHLGTQVTPDNLHSWKAKEFRSLYRDTIEANSRTDRRIGSTPVGLLGE